MRRGILRAAQYTSILLWIVWASHSGSAQAVDAADTVAESSGEAHIAGKATVHVDVGRPGAEPIPRYLTGKFCEHLGNNIYHGMDAQILRNPTFAVYPFWTGEMSPDGVTAFHSERDQIVAQLKQQASRVGWPKNQLDRLSEAYDDGLACWWIREGDRDSVRVSPDTGPAGQRAQRIEIQQAGQGMAQWIALPLHRTRSYECELLVRSPDTVRRVIVSLRAPDSQQPVAQTELQGPVSSQWTSLRGRLQVDAQADADASYRLSLTVDDSAQLVVARLRLWPADHIGGADPDVIARLRESRLPILRWPGGNFVSGYHWLDGVGPIDARPTLPNFAWGGVETNLFGTDEFLAFCRAVGCEPMICVNAGNGTPDEAARWIEYCNGSADTPMGKLRAAHGHPEPYGVKHWEVGNELWGRWQYHWTTATGYVDRLKTFAAAMRAVDPTIQLYVCGAPAMWGKEWNDVLIGQDSREVLLTSPITDHPLIGGQVPRDTDPLDVYRDFMAVPDVLSARWAALRQQMREANIPSPQLAVTELQLFARVGQAGAGTARLTHDNLVNPGTLAEALYDALIYHRAIRLAPFVTMVTHSATVNHGGGLRKQRERVYANPCHHLQAAMAELSGATPVDVRIESPEEVAPLTLPDLKSATTACSYKTIDAVAAVDPQGTCWVSLVHRGSQGPIDVAVELAGAALSDAAELRTLTADVPWAANSLEDPERVRPIDSQVEVHDSRVTLRLAPYTWVRMRIPAAAQ